MFFVIHYSATIVHIIDGTIAISLPLETPDNGVCMCHHC